MSAHSSIEGSDVDAIVAGRKDSAFYGFLMGICALVPLLFAVKEILIRRAITNLSLSFLMMAMIEITFGIYVWLRARNDRIVLSGDRITWFDWRGKLRVSCPLGEIIPGTYFRHKPRLVKLPKRGESLKWYELAANVYSLSVNTACGRIYWLNTVSKQGSP